jgi:hypothetical protein
MYVNRINSGNEMRSLYERLRWYQNIEEEPLFWLQFAILEIDEGRLGEAKSHLDYAYKKAQGKETFKPYQIDTQYYRLIIDSILDNIRIFEDKEAELINKYTEIVSDMLTQETHRDFAFKQLERLPDVAQKIFIGSSDEDKNEMRQAISYVLEIFSTLSDEVKMKYDYTRLLDKLIISLRLFDSG